MTINNYKHRINKNICDTHLAHGYISQINLIQGEKSEREDNFMTES